MSNEDKILNDAIRTYGSKHQLFVAVEELSELQKELCKYLRGMGNIEHIAEEVADVHIILAQIESIFNCSDSVGFHIDSKLMRLESRIKAKRGERT